MDPASDSNKNRSVAEGGGTVTVNRCDNNTYVSPPVGVDCWDQAKAHSADAAPVSISATHGNQIKHSDNVTAQTRDSNEEVRTGIRLVATGGGAVSVGRSGNVPDVTPSGGAPVANTPKPMVVAPLL